MKFTEAIQLHIGRKLITMKATFSVSVVVAPADLAVAPTLAPEKVGLAVADKLAISGGTPPYVLSNFQGTLPSGVTLDDQGNVSGTPTAPGTFGFTIDVADAQG